MTLFLIKNFWFKKRLFACISLACAPLPTLGDSANSEFARLCAELQDFAPKF